MYSIKLFFLLCKWEFCNNNFKVTFCNTRKIDYIFILKKNPENRIFEYQANSIN